MPAGPTYCAARLGAGSRRGAALPFGVLLLTGVVFIVLAGLRLSEGSLRQAELDRERGRVWGMTCAALHRAVQAGMVTGPGAFRPGPIAAPATVTVAQLKQPPVPLPPALPFPPFLPAGLSGVDTAGAAGLSARYGAAVDGRGVAMAVCSLSGTDLAGRAGSLREGAVMGGLDLVGAVGGEDTPMHGRLADVRSVLGPLANGSLFATADFGIGHRMERAHRRAVGGRPELSRMERGIRFGFGDNITDVGAAVAEDANADRGSAPGMRTEVGGEVSAEVLRLAGGSGMRVSADRGFAFGGVQSAFAVPGELAVGTALGTGDVALESRGAVSAQSLTVAAELVADGGVDATAGVNAGSLAVSGAVSGNTARVTGTVTVRMPPCNGCSAPGL